MHKRILTIAMCLFIATPFLSAGKRTNLLVYIAELEAKKHQIAEYISGEKSGESLRQLQADARSVARRLAEAKEKLKHCNDA